MNLEPKTPTAPKVSIRFKCWYLIYERGQNVISDVPGQSECFRLLLLLLQLLISMYIVWHFIDVVPHFANRKPLRPNAALWWAGACTETCWKLSKAEQVPDFTTAGRDVEFGYFPLTYCWILYSAISIYDYTAWCFWKKKNQRIGDSNSGTLKWMLWKAPPGLASSSGHMKISPAAQCLRQGVEQLGIRRDDSFPKEVTGTVRLEFCRVGSLGILMLLCAVKARQIRSCLNEALIALHSNVTNNPECGTLSLFCSSSFIWRLREFETIHYSWSWLLFFATKSFCFTVIGPCL